MSQKTQYTFIARTLHWLVAGLIVSQYVLSELAENAEHSGRVVEQLALLANHKSIGMTVVVLAVFRLLWRYFNVSPAPQANMPAWQHTVSGITHWALYVLIFAVPISGWLMSSANAYSVSWFNLFVFPDLLNADENVANILNWVHEILAKSLLVLAIMHIAAALKHHFIDKDGVMVSMASAFGWGLFITVVALAVFVLGNVKSTAKPAIELSLEQKEGVEAVAGAKIVSDLPLWNIDYSNSYIRFSGDQAGAPFRGEWLRWKAAMQFDKDNLSDSVFDVTIDTSKVASGDKDRDDYIIGADFFDVAQFKQAKFWAQDFKVQDQANGEKQFMSQGNLSIKGLGKPLLFTFTVEQQATYTTLNGAATIDRLAWKVGTGDWADPTWVGKEVTVEVKVVALIP